MSTHSLLSPSAAHRWMACPGSVPLTKDIPNKTSKYAQEGTQAHELAAAMLLNQAEAPREGDSTVEMWSYCDVYVQEIKRRAHGKLLLVEQRVDPRAVTGSPDHSGTADAVILDMAESTIEVHDLKYGRGHQVFAGDNEQLMLYGLGALCSYDHILEAQTFKLFIHQPRLDHMDEYRLSRDQLLAFGEQVKAATADVEAACLSYKGGFPDSNEQFLNPSDDACRWCDAKPTCPALRTMVTDCVFEAVDKPKDPQTITDLPSARTLSLIEQWCSSVRDLIFAKVNTGEEVAGWKLVMGKKGNRKWKDESTVAGLLKKLRIKKADGFSKPKVKSPAQLEKIVPDDKWDQLEALIEQPPGKPTLVSEDDKRPEHKPVDFEDQTKTEGNR